MKKILFLLTVVMNGLIAEASISYTAKIDPTLLEIITEGTDSSGHAALYYPNTYNRYADGEPVFPIINYSFSVPYNAVDFTIESTLAGEQNVDLHMPLAIYYNENPPEQSSETDVLNTANVVISQFGYLCGTNKVVTVSINPFVYNDSDLTMYTQVQFTINWRIEPDENTLRVAPAYNSQGFVKGLETTRKAVVNPEAVETNAPSIAMPLTTDQEEYDYIIIAVDKLFFAAQRLAAMRRVMGYGSKVFSLSYALSLYPNGDTEGFTDDAGKLKEFIKYCYRSFGTRNVLLLGKYPEMPIRKYASSASNSCRFQYPTDLYFADFNSKWNPLSDGNANFIKYDAENIDFYAEVNIGRIPAETEDDVNNYIDKLKIYEWNPGNGNYGYLSRGFLARQVDDDIDLFDSASMLPFYKLFEEGGLCQLIAQPKLKGSEVVETLNGYSSVIHNFMGHGNPGGIGTGKNSEGVSYGLLSLENTTGVSKYDWNHAHETKNGLDNLTNKYYPGWTHSMSCSLMPFDIMEESKTMKYDVKKNFGESYILGEGYGGVVMLGNTRPAGIGEHKVFIRNFYEKVWKSYKDPSADPYEKLFASTMCNHVWQIPSSSFYKFDGVYEKLMYNVLGDPLTELRFGEPVQFTINKQSGNSNEYNIGIFGSNSTEYYQFVTVPLIDATYASYEECDVRVDKSIELYPNEIQVLTAKNAIPQILPLHIQNFVFDASSAPYIFADMVFLEKANPNDKEDCVLFKNTADITIESLRDVYVDYGTIFESGSKLTINAGREANLCRITIPAGATLIVNAPKIVYGEDMVTFHPNSTVILNGKKITNGSAKSVARGSEYDPLVKEGKTFWYWQRNQYNPTNFLEFGMRIGSKVNVDGEDWNEVVLIRKAELDKAGNVLSVSDESQTIQYIREKDMKVQTRDCPEQFEYYHWNTTHTNVSLWHFFKHSPNIGCIYNLYDFAPGAEEYIFGTNESRYTMTLKREEVRENSGINRRVKVYTKAAFDSEVLIEEPFSYIMKGEEFELIEGVGIKLLGMPLDISKEHFINELLFAPFCCEQVVSTPQPFGYFLRYVTDEANNVVYEGHGGLKLWTLDPSGVEDVTYDATEDVEWYTLSGVRVHSPSQHGVYIRKTGSKAETVRF